MRQKVFFGWVVVAVAFGAVLLSAGVRSAPGVFLVPMLADSQSSFTRPVISAAIALGLVFFGIAAPVSGWLMDKFGPRRMMLVSMLLIATAMALSSRLSTEFELTWFWGALSGVATGITGGVLGATIANRWFHQRRSLVVGIFGAAGSAGQLIFVPTLNSLAVNIGWRNGALVLGLLALAMIVPILIFMRDSPSEIGIQPYGAIGGLESKTTKHIADKGIMRLVIRSPQFWLLAATFFVCGATSNGIIGTHFIAHTADHGIPLATASVMLSILGATNFAGSLASGWLCERYDPRKLLCIYYGFRGLSLLLLPVVTDSAIGLVLFSVMFGLDYIATVPPTIALCADTFGRKNVGTVYGWVFCAHQIGAASAAWLGGLARTFFGEYGSAFIVAGAIGLIAALLALMIRRSTTVSTLSFS